MYKHTLKRYYTSRNSEGEVEAIYFLINSTDGVSQIKREINLNKKERQLLLTNQDLKKILEPHILSIKTELDELTKINPYPPIEASDDELQSITQLLNS